MRRIIAAKRIIAGEIDYAGEIGLSQGESLPQRDTVCRRAKPLFPARFPRIMRSQAALFLIRQIGRVISAAGVLARRRFASTAPYPSTRASGGNSPQQVWLSSRGFTHEFAFTLDQKIDHLGVAVAAAIPLALPESRKSRASGASIVD